MLLELHVRNLALIEKADLEFTNGLTVFTGETGAGKSILIDSINIALGAKTSPQSIRTGAEYTYIELVFAIDDKEKIEEIRKLDIGIEDDGMLIVSRKIMPARSVMKVNDETVTAGKLRSLTGLLIDMHGQFEHQSLLYPSKHLEYIDKMSPDEALTIRKEIKDLYSEYSEISGKLNVNEDAALREREADILRYEIDEIEKADLREGEEEELLTDFRKMKNSSKISEGLSKALENLDSQEISYAQRELADIVSYDDKLENIRDMFSDIESLLDEARRSIEEYAESLDYDEENFERIEERLDIIHRLQGKYGDDITKIKASVNGKRERLEYLENYDANRNKLINRKNELAEELEQLCDRLSGIRKRTAADLKKRIIEELNELNFLGVKFDIDFSKPETFTANGNDTVRFMISTNPGEPLRPLADVASGGELSRIMLALKTVLADTDEIYTLIFDEIDAGISGITAQKVGDKLRKIGIGHQVLCITHLAQIASRSDNHYLIRKSTDGSSTRTEIRRIDKEERTEELARLIGGDKITESVLAAAREMLGENE